MGDAIDRLVDEQLARGEHEGNDFSCKHCGAPARNGDLILVTEYLMASVCQSCEAAGLT
jgi:hypothetical protein